MQMQAAATTSVEKTGNLSDLDYQRFVDRVNERFAALTGPKFQTEAEGLWDAYLASFPESTRQHHNCSACRHFIERYGGLVTIDDQGMTAPAVWNLDDADDEHRAALSALIAIVRRAKVTGPFLSSEDTWGDPVTGVWCHLALRNERVFKKLTITSGQAMAEKREDFKNVVRALQEFTPPMLDQALTLLRSEALYRSEKVLGQAEWLRNLHAAIDGKRGHARTNAIWRAVAEAPAGFCHPRSSMIGTLLDDIAAGVSFKDASRKFAAKMHPLQYQRPQAPPSAGNIAQAEKVIAQLGAAGALARRFARIDELETIWKPGPEKQEPKDGGVFSHLKPKDGAEVPEMIGSAQTITFDKFRRTVLGEALKIELFVPSHGNFCALVTAVNADAPPILQWDLPERRNPVNWYVYHGGSPCSRWGIVAGWTELSAIALQPTQWYGGNFAHQGDGAHFVIPGAKDSAAGTAGIALFPETLKAEFHSIRSTIEAYSRGAKLEGTEEASANGLKITKGQGCDVRLRVTFANKTRAEYRIDRWD